MNGIFVILVLSALLTLPLLCSFLPAIIMTRQDSADKDQTWVLPFVYAERQ